MISSAPKFLIYGISQEAWTKRWGVEPFTIACYACERPITTLIPFVQGTLRGLIAPVCVCGDPFPPYAIVRDPRHGDLLSGGDGRLDR